jgi:hypothetical protein
MRRRATVVAFCGVLCLSALMGCTDVEQTTSSADTGASAAVVASTVTIRTNWDARCDVSWVLWYDDRSWKSPAAGPLDQVKVGEVRSASADELEFVELNGTFIRFVPDEPAVTACS